MSRNLDKHQKYKEYYKPNDLYWGLGIEHETYIETNKLKQITLKELKENRGTERYSVNYYNIYTADNLIRCLDGLFDSNSKILIPILINSHTFQKTDIYGEHMTTYERIPKPNPKYSGQTFFDWLKQQNPGIFEKEFEASFVFDGDTIEFMTQKFYKATIKSVISELKLIEHKFMAALHLVPKEGIVKTYGPFQIAQKNYPFASYLTNLKNNAMFNNGTIHINITLPTQLNEKAEIANYDLFRSQHQNFARAIQWLSPLLIAKYGSPDPLCESKTNGEKYSAGSQRVAVSRYIGLGTYDTDLMETGKILTKSREKLKNIDWYISFHEKVDYTFLNDLGMDFNFNKHFCHGLEFRVLDSIPIADLEEILKIIVHLADFSLDREIENPKKSQLWHMLAENCVHNGKGYCIDVSDQYELLSIFNLDSISKEPVPITDMLTLIHDQLAAKYKDGICAQYMIHGKQPPLPPSPIVALSNSMWCC